MVGLAHGGTRPRPNGIGAAAHPTAAQHVVNFKRRVYEQALRHLVPLAETSCSVTLREQRWIVELAAT